MHHEFTTIFPIDFREEMRLLQTEATEILHLILRGAEKEQIGKPRMQEHIYGAVR